MNRSLLWSLGAAVAVGLAVALVPKETPAERPNIVLIFSDDQGYHDVSLFGGDIPTPHIDRIGREGARFTAWYSASPVCTPSRYGLLTGRAPDRARNGLEKILMPTRAADSSLGLTAEEVTLAGLLKGRGYRTALIGKWHLGHGTKADLPPGHGFDRFFGHTAGCTDYFRMCYGNLPDWYRDEEQVEVSGYATDLLTDEAVRFIRAQSPEQPFFLYLPYNAPHYGKGWDEAGQKMVNVLQAKPEDLEAMGHIQDPDRRVYAAMVKALDDGVGRVLDALREAGLEENTWVLFLSDNGGAPDYGGRNEPLRGAKATLWEGGIRVPAVMRWPGRIPAGTVVDEPLSSLDLVPTVGGLLGLDTSGLVLDGQDVRRVLFEGERIERTLVWSYRQEAAVREGAWKYLRQGEAAPMLFRLDEDPAERNDLAARHPDVVDRLARRHTAWLQTLAVP